MLNPSTSRTFQEYGETVFAPYISAQLEKSTRVDLVWDVYLPASLKASTRQKRGKGTRKRVAPPTVMPKNWKDFLRCDENKTELFSFLSREAVHLDSLAQGKELYATDGTGVLCSPAESCLACLAPCSQEEADTRLLLHVADAVQKSCKKLLQFALLRPAAACLAARSLPEAYLSPCSALRRPSSVTPPCFLAGTPLPLSPPMTPHREPSPCLHHHGLFALSPFRDFAAPLPHHPGPPHTLSLPP
ncbi:hypothetical protein SKAU_G00210470 [Synaphobranchus kaupii]|uniref:Uncharacterized protein n=1 Tax=Synaphobranchus kaupii TaxID=118154 RepID=A0A9Q1F8Y3_SYNKA|nr:hypothetical protein SKAU_G00210470 [Synaphobranchus kaupii]